MYSMADAPKKQKNVRSVPPYDAVNEPLVTGVAAHLAVLHERVLFALSMREVPDTIGNVIVPERLDGQLESDLLRIEKDVAQLRAQWDRWRSGVPPKRGERPVDLATISAQMSDLYRQTSGLFFATGMYEAHNLELLQQREQGKPTPPLYYGANDVLQAARSNVDILLDKTPMGQALAAAGGVITLAPEYRLSPEYVTRLFEDGRVHILNALYDLRRSNIQLGIGEGEGKMEALFAAIRNVQAALKPPVKQFEQPDAFGETRRIQNAQYSAEAMMRAFLEFRTSFNTSMHRYQTAVFKDKDFTQVQASYFEGMMQLGEVVKELGKQAREVNAVPISHQGPAITTPRDGREL